jgi:hypothetical protein
MIYRRCFPSSQPWLPKPRSEPSTQLPSTSLISLTRGDTDHGNPCREPVKPSRQKKLRIFPRLLSVPACLMSLSPSTLELPLLPPGSSLHTNRVSSRAISWNGYSSFLTDCLFSCSFFPRVKTVNFLHCDLDYATPQYNRLKLSSLTRPNHIL